MDWGWGNGFKIRKDIWSRIAVKLRVRRIPVCWKHLEFWETFDSFMFLCWVLHDVWNCGCRRMPRLYLQKGLSSRVIRAVSQRLERVLSMATGAGDRVDSTMDDARTRSRSPVRAPGAEASGPDGTVNVNPGESLPLPEGTVPIPDETPTVPEGAVEVPSLDVIPTNPAEPDALRDQLTKCVQKLQSVSFELAAAVDSYGDHHDKLREEVAKLGLKLEKQSQALTTVGAAMASEVLEVNKLLKAFDRFAGLFKWAFGGKNSVEANLGFIQACIIEQKSQLETSLLGAMTTMNGLLEKIVENTSRDVRDAAHPPAFFLPAAPDTSGTGHVDPGIMEAGTPLPGYASGVPGYTSTPGSASAAAASPVATAVPPPPVAKGAACAVRAPAEREMISVFLCYCAENVGGVRNTTPSNAEVPSQRQGLYTRDGSTGQVRVLSPTVYNPQQASRITAAWAPKGLASLRDSPNSVRRIY